MERDGDATTVEILEFQLAMLDDPGLAEAAIDNVPGAAAALQAAMAAHTRSSPATMMPIAAPALPISRICASLSKASRPTRRTCRRVLACLPAT